MRGHEIFNKGLHARTDTPPQTTGGTPVTTGGGNLAYSVTISTGGHWWNFFRKMNCELWKIIENYYFIMESEGYLNFQKFTSAFKKFCSN